jgi:hypothetical protein
MPRKPDTFIRRIPLDLTRALAPQLAELAEDSDPEIARWAAEQLALEQERTRLAAARRTPGAPATGDPRRERRGPALKLVRRR